jgi:hypothetical protein
MAIIVKLLAAETFSASSKDLYTVPNGKSAIVRSVRLVNGNASPTPTMNLYVKASGASTIARRLHDKDFTISAKGGLVVQDAVTLGQGDKIQLTLASAQGNTSFMVNGVERE